MSGLIQCSSHVLKSNLRSSFGTEAHRGSTDDDVLLTLTPSDLTLTPSDLTLTPPPPGPGADPGAGVHHGGLPGAQAAAPRGAVPAPGPGAVGAGEPAAAGGPPGHQGRPGALQREGEHLLCVNLEARGGGLESGDFEEIRF